MTTYNVEVRFDARAAVARLFTRTLTVPQVFFEAAWPDAKRHVDILAIDRAGSGDVHVVEIKSRFDQVTTPVIRQLSRMPSHYRWIAAPTRGINNNLVDVLAAKLAEPGIGLIGIAIVANGDAGANVISTPVRTASFDRTTVGDFLKRHVPDIEYCESPPASNKNRTEVLSKSKVLKHLDEADQLFEQGHQRAAYLLAWSATEAAMKLLLGETGQAPMSSPGTLLRAIKESGRAMASEVDSLRSALGIRNMLVHGLAEPRGVKEAYRTVTAIARKLIKT